MWCQHGKRKPRQKQRIKLVPERDQLLWLCNLIKKDNKEEEKQKRKRDQSRRARWDEEARSAEAATAAEMLAAVRTLKLLQLGLRTPAVGAAKRCSQNVIL